MVLALISLSETNKQTNKKIRLILVHVSENVCFNSSMCGTHPVQFHPSVTHTEPSCSKNSLQRHSCSHPGQRTFPSCFILTTLDITFKKIHCNLQQLHKCQQIKSEHASSSSKQNSQTSTQGPSRASLKFCLYKTFYLSSLPSVA